MRGTQLERIARMEEKLEHVDKKIDTNHQTLLESLNTITDKLDKHIEHSSVVADEVRNHSEILEVINSTSVGLWIRRHPFKFTLYVIMILGLILSISIYETRHFVIDIVLPILVGVIL